MRPVPPEPQRPQSPPAVGFGAVPQEVREEMAAAILGMGGTVDYTMLQRLSLYIVAQVVKGTINSAQADSVRRYLEFMLMTVVMDMQTRQPDQSKTPSTTDVIARLKAAESAAKKVRRVLTIDVAPENA